MKNLVCVLFLFFFGCSTVTKNDSSGERSIANVSDEYDSLLHNDLRDIIIGDSDIENIARDLIKYIRKEYKSLTGLSSIRCRKCYTAEEIHSLGPAGKIIKGKPFDADFRHRAQDILAGVYLEKLDVEDKNNFIADLLIAVFDRNGLLFKKLKIKRSEGKIALDGEPRNVYLEQTDFIISLEVATQNAFFIDKSNNITIVAPIAVGAFEIDPGFKKGDKLRSYSLMNQFTNKDVSESLEHNCVLMPYETFKYLQNTFSRNYPSIFAGRPMLAVIEKNKQGGVEKFPPTFISALKDSDESIHALIKRGFTTYGNIIMTDRDLYMLSAIINQSRKPETHLEIKMSFGEKFEHIDSLYPRVPKVLQSTFKIGKKGRTKCSSPGKIYRHRNYKFEGRDYHTVMNEDCITKLSESELYTTQELMSFILKREGNAPKAIIE
jgi:hypothetical protein